MKTLLVYISFFLTFIEDIAIGTRDYLYLDVKLSSHEEIRV